MFSLIFDSQNFESILAGLAVCSWGGVAAYSWACCVQLGLLYIVGTSLLRIVGLAAYSWYRVAVVGVHKGEIQAREDPALHSSARMGDTEHDHVPCARHHRVSSHGESSSLLWRRKDLRCRGAQLFWTRTTIQVYVFYVSILYLSNA